MPLTFTERQRAVFGNLKAAVYTVGFDTSYAASGEPLVPTTLGFDTFLFVKAQAPAGFHVTYDYATQVLRAFRVALAATAGADIAVTANNQIVQNAAVTGVEVSGAGTAFQANLVEVAAATDLSTALAAVRVIFYGR